MESVVATVSGYHGTDRFNLIKLISYSGANYVGALSPSITHLVCWKFEGAKYQLAKKLQISIVNHQWVEESVRKGERLPEYPYTLQSGMDIGPLSLEIPIVDNISIANKKRKVQLDEFRIHCDSDTPIPLRNLEHGKWTPSSLPQIINISYKPNHMLLPSSSSYLADDFPTTKLLQSEDNKENFSLLVHSPKGKKILKSGKLPKSAHSTLLSDNQELPDEEGSRMLVSSRTKRTLAKHSRAKAKLELVLLDSDGENELHRVSNNGGDNITLFQRRDTEAHQNVCKVGFDGDESSNDRFMYGNGINEDAERSDQNHSAVNSDNLLDGVINFQARRNYDFDTESERIQKDDGEIGPATISPCPAGLSCVICWTEFSSIRGILGCGHRFCYACIKEWSEHLASMRKVSRCPLCKANFVSIKKVEDPDIHDQKIYSLTIPPDSPTMDVLHPWEPSRNAQFSEVCCCCQGREQEDIVYCHVCQMRCIHMYCMDPVLLPWQCAPCKELGLLYGRQR